MKRILVFTALLMVSSLLKAQTVVYTSNGNEMMSELSFKKERDIIKKKFSKIFKKEMFVGTKIKKTERRNDSIIHFISFDVKDKKSKKSKMESLLGKEFPNFKFKDITGKEISLESLKGKPTLINFWFTKCPPCIDEMPHLNKLKKKYNNSMNFISMTYENKDAVNKFLSKKEFNFKHIVDVKEFTDKLEIESFPLNVFLDENLKIKVLESGLPYQRVNGKMVIKSANSFEDIIKTLNIK